MSEPIENAWEFSCKWYTVAEISSSIRMKLHPVPKDVFSEEFAAWLTEQYRLAMAKGIELGKASREMPSPPTAEH